MRVLFLNPPFKFKISRTSRWPEYTKSGTFYYPFWLAYAAGLAEKTGHKVLLLDAVANSWSVKETINKIVRFKPNLLVVETCTPTVYDDIRFIEEVKRSLDVKIVLTGSHPTALPEETLLLSDSIDFVARGEYDYTISDLAKALEKKKGLNKVLGLTYRKDKEVVTTRSRPLNKNLDDFPFVSKIYKKFLNIEDYRYSLARHPMVQVFSSRGCPNRCVFCLLPQTMMTRTFRTRSPKNFVDELEWIKNNLKVKEIFIEDDTFTTDKQRVVEICKMIKERNLGITWSANVRADVPYEVLKEMKAAGCRMLIVGYESGSQLILNNIKKGITIQQAEEFTRNAKKFGLKIFGCFMIGLPGDTKKTVMQTFNYAKKISPDMVFFQQAVPFPGTEFYEYCDKNGYLLTKDFSKWLDKNGKLDFLVNYPNLSNEAIKDLREKLMIKFYTSPRAILKTITSNLHPYEMQRIMKAALDYFSFISNKK